MQIAVKQRRSPEVVVMVDHHFGVLQLSRDGGEVLHGVSLGGGVAEALESLRASGVRVTIAVPEALGVESVTRLSRILSGSPKVVAGTGAARTLKPSVASRIVVAADRVVRARAVKAGGRALPHVVLAALELKCGPLHFVRALGTREAFERLRHFVPYFAEPAEREQMAVLGVLGSATIDKARHLGIAIEELPLDLAVEDPMFVRLDNRIQSDRLSRCRVLASEDGRVLVALPPETMNDDVGVHGAHGHFLVLSPSTELLKPAPAPGSALRRARLAIDRWPRRQALEEIAFSPDIRRWLVLPCPSSATQFQGDVDRFSGAGNLDAAGPIASRHIRHADNARVVQALLAELSDIGYCAYTHSFTHAGLTLNSVIADLPGTGLLHIHPEIPEILRDLVIKHPWPDPPSLWRTTLREVGGEEFVRDLGLGVREARELRAAVLRIGMFEDWFPWWLRLCRLPGLGAEVVIVGCHLDSTAAFTPGGYNPLTDPAPGADDNASGIAAALAIARYLWQFRNSLPHTVRFCFFNAEEQGMVGSRAYAQHLKAAGAPVRAVVCADMIGYNSDVNRIFEIHAGYTDAGIRDASVPIANTIAAWAATLGALAPAQIYSGTSSSTGADRTLHDGAIGRSDHASFHEQGYPAVVVSEDFFINTPGEPLKDSNPNYHDGDDLVVDSGYAADITCAMAYAVKELAGG